MHLAAMGMMPAIIGTLLHHDIVRYDRIIGGLLLGTAIVSTPCASWRR